MTLGVRGAAFDGAGRVCLVRHTYVAGWHLPGGGVEIGESAAEAMLREFREEAEIAVPPEALQLRGLYRNLAGSRRDHVALYVVHGVTRLREKLPDREIAACAFFPLDALPEGTTRGTAARLHEIRGGLEAAAHW
ncbi:DNA mismatch repair protein MutT [Methylobacterium radiodurans]|uniref:DNA mismatch repair protein MutT n=2 Tax=Methylobacterium radiodurans TaxID=2202828 RepID=A0A2U8W0K2_9HYPH|nr:DNA mismatch repair protein MutT [Methylobacterium radiodurans]